MTFEQSVANRAFDFFSQTPESMHMVMLVFSPRLRRSRAGDRRNLTRKRIPRTNDCMQAGERYQLSEQWEKDDLVANLVDALSQCDRSIQQRMLWHLYMCEDGPGGRR